MIRRVVLFRRKAEIPREQFFTAINELRLLDRRIPQIASWWIDTSASPNGGWEAALVADFHSAEDLRTYEEHADHVKAASQVAQVAEFALFDGTA